MDATTKAIAEALRRWHEAPSAQVICLEKERERRQRERWLIKHTRPIKPEPPRAA